MKLTAAIENFRDLLARRTRQIAALQQYEKDGIKEEICPAMGRMITIRAYPPVDRIDLRPDAPGWIRLR